MINITVNVFCNLRDDSIVDILKTITYFEGVTIKFCDMFDDAVGYCLLISDNPDEAAAFKTGSNSKARLFSVCIASNNNCESFAEKIDDIWPSNESIKYTVARFKKMINYINHCHMEWFYKNLYTSATDVLPAMAWCKDTNGLFLSVNEHLSKTVNRSKDECIGKDHLYVWRINNDDAGPNEQILVDSEHLVMTEQRTVKLDETLITDSGNMKLNAIKAPLFNEFGDVVGTVGVANDITNYINAQHENALLIESVPFPVVVVDVNWKTKMVNGTMRRLLDLDGPIEKFDYLTWKKYFLTPKTEPIIDNERHFVNQIFTANDDRIKFDFQINEQDIIDVFGNVTGHIIIPRKLGPSGEMLGKPAL